jgi:hypothetical protein
VNLSSICPVFMSLGSMGQSQSKLMRPPTRSGCPLILCFSPFSIFLPVSLLLSFYLATFLTPFKFHDPLVSVSLGISLLSAHLPVRSPFVSSLQKIHQVGAREAGSYHKVEIARRDLFDVVAFIGMERRISSPLLPWPPSKCTIPNMSILSNALGV